MNFLEVEVRKEKKNPSSLSRLQSAPDRFPADGEPADANQDGGGGGNVYVKTNNIQFIIPNTPRLVHHC